MASITPPLLEEARGAIVMPEAFRTDPVATLFSLREEIATRSAILWFSAVALFDKAFNRFSHFSLAFWIKRLLDGFRKVFTTIITSNNIGKILRYFRNYIVQPTSIFTPIHSRNSTSPSCLLVRSIFSIVLIPNRGAISARRNRCRMF